MWNDCVLHNKGEYHDFIPLFYRIGDDALIAVGQGCHQLKQINVSGCHRVGDSGLSAIARGCPLLLHLDVSVCQVSCLRFSSIFWAKVEANQQSKNLHILNWSLNLFGWFISTAIQLQNPLMTSAVGKFLFNFIWESIERLESLCNLTTIIIHTIRTI